MAENLALKQQLIALNRRNRRSPKLTLFERFLYGLLAFVIGEQRIHKIAVILKPATIRKFHRALLKKKYSPLFSNKSKTKPGPKGGSQELINAIVEMNQRNPRFGCPRIAQKINLAFGLGVVRRILEKHYKPTFGDNDPS